MIALAVLLALLPAAWLTLHRVLHQPAAAPQHPAATDLPIPPVSPRPTTPASSAATSTSTPAPTTTAPTRSAPLPQVRPDTPRRLVAGSVLDAGFDSAVSALEPASTSEVARLGTRGSPGSPGTDTVVVVGTVTAGGGGALGHLPEVGTGAEVSIRTDAGTMTYTVAGSTMRAVSGLASDTAIAGHVPGRLVLVGIRYAASGDRLPEALVVTAVLTGAAVG